MHLFIDEKTFYYIYYTEMGFAAILFGINILISIFLCNEFRKPKSIFRSSYFYILNSFYVLRIPYTVAWVYGRTSYYQLDDPLLPYVLLLQWYTQSLQGMWEAVLGLSRMTALAFPNLHKLVSFY
uniref:Serpentine receptor class gamma n=1 Tax=Panagrolaimus sp. PS1159 TaxID=55785 RepID=A0AC35FFT9_9BILA